MYHCNKRQGWMGDTGLIPYSWKKCCRDKGHLGNCAFTRIDAIIETSREFITEHGFTLSPSHKRCDLCDTDPLYEVFQQGVELSTTGEEFERYYLCGKVCLRCHRIWSHSGLVLEDRPSLQGWLSQFNTYKQLSNQTLQEMIGVLNDHIQELQSKLAPLPPANTPHRGYLPAASSGLRVPIGFKKEQ